MYCAEVYGARRISLQFLAEFKNVVIDSARRRIVLIAPDFVEQLIAADDAVGILHQKLKRFEFLCRQNNRLPVALDFHPFEVGRDAIEADYLQIGSVRGVAQSRADACQ